MKPEEKQRLLTIEFVKILKKAEEICEQCAEEFENIGGADDFNKLYWIELNQIKLRNSNLLELIKSTQTELTKNFGLSPQNVDDIDFEKIQAIKDFQNRLNCIFNTESSPINDVDVQKKAYQKQDVVSAQLSILSRIEMDLTHVLRKLFQTIEAIFTGTKIKADDPNLGETRFALRVTGQSQFFPRPMTSLKDAELALDDISMRLNDCIKLNNPEDDQLSDEYKF